MLRFIVHTDGEIIRKAVPDVGYLHRSIEKIAERWGFPEDVPPQAEWNNNGML